MSFIPNFNQKVTITSSTTWTCPAGVFWALLTISAGGGGGYLNTDNSTFMNSAGGGGGQWKQMMIPVVPGTTYTFVIASGGTGTVSFANSPGSATAGGNSYVYTATSQTTLAAATSNGASNGNIDLTAVTGITGGSIIQVDNEMMLVLNPGTAGGTNTYVIRAFMGTAAAVHSNGATVNLISVIALALGGSAAINAQGGNGGGADGFSGGGGANNSLSIGAGTGKTAQNGRGGIGGGGGAYSSSQPFAACAGGTTEAAMGFAFQSFGLTTSGFGGGQSVSGGASWGPGNPGGDYSASVTNTPAANTGGGGGSGAAGSSGGALIAYQAA